MTNGCEKPLAGRLIMNLKKLCRRYYYHASKHDINWPCETENAKHKLTPACASLFANCSRDGVIYGGNLYRFKLKGPTRVLSLCEDDYYEYRHNPAFRARLFSSQAKRDAYKAIACPISRHDISLVVLDFTAFKSWERVC
jgi:hypothetical protein